MILDYIKSCLFITLLFVTILAVLKVNEYGVSSTTVCGFVEACRFNKGIIELHNTYSVCKYEDYKEATASSNLDLTGQ